MEQQQQIYILWSRGDRGGSAGVGAGRQAETEVARKA